MSTTKRIALVPYEPGAEPEGMVSSLDPDALGRIAECAPTISQDHATRRTIAAAVKAARRDPWTEWRESLGFPWRVDADGGVHDERNYQLTFRRHGDDAAAQDRAIAALPDMAEALRSIIEDVGDDFRVEHLARAALRKAGAPADEPDFLDEVVEESTALDPEFPDKVSAAMAQLRHEPERSHRPPNGALHGEYDRPEPESTEDVPELWVSRDASCPAGDWSDLWTKGKPVLDDDGQWLGPLDNAGSYYMPTRLSRVLGLGPGDCRRVTRDEYERFFKPVLDLPPSERYAALERLAL